MNYEVLLALWFFLPAGIANMTPVLIAHVPALQRLNAPMDGGKSFRGQRIFGDHKTWRGLISGILLGVIIVYLQAVIYRHSHDVRTFTAPIDYSHVNIALLGFLLSFGALLGDALESFAKRQFKIAAGHTWFPFDQLDYIIGGLVCASLYIRLPAVDYAWIVVIWFGMHLLFSYIGYLLKLKNKPI